MIVAQAADPVFDIWFLEVDRITRLGVARQLILQALLDVDFGIFFFAEIIKVLAHALVEGLRAANYARFQNRVFRLYFLTALFDHLLRVARRVTHLPT